MDTRESVRGFIQKKVGPDVAFSTADDIFKLGMVNSMFALELVMFLEGTFGIRVENEDLKLENFSSVDNLDSFIHRKKGMPG